MRTFVLLLAATAIAGSVHAEDPPDPNAPGLASGERLGALVERMRQEQESLTSLQADFVQTKESSMLLEPSEAAGTFYYAAPDRVRWEYRTPDPISMVIADDRMTTWYRDLDRAEEVDVGRQSQKILEYLGAGSSLSTLLEYFDVKLHQPGDASAPLELELEPRFERVAKRLAGMSLWIDPELYLPVRLRYIEADGDVTDYRFSNFRLNTEIPDERFRLEIPESVAVRRIDLNRRGGR
ncbi:MAG: outer membrane lipoprotein carrier protein LolA [Thermoanaerobaculia bacterium]